MRYPRTTMTNHVATKEKILMMSSDVKTAVVEALKLWGIIESRNIRMIIQTDASQDLPTFSNDARCVTQSFMVNGVILYKFQSKKNGTQRKMSRAAWKGVIEALHARYPGPDAEPWPKQLDEWVYSQSAAYAPDFSISKDDKAETPVAVVYSTGGLAGPEVGIDHANLVVRTPELLNALRNLVYIVKNSLGPRGYTGDRFSLLNDEKWSDFDQVKKAQELVDMLDHIQ